MTITYWTNFSKRKNIRNDLSNLLNKVQRIREREWIKGGIYVITVTCEKFGHY